MLKCCACKKSLPNNAFSKKNGSSRGYSYKCKECHNTYVRETWYKKNSGKQIKAVKAYRKRNPNKDLAWRHGVALKDVDSILSRSNGLCEICGTDAKLVLDHCHKTSKGRGLLCQQCNTGLGMFRDSTKNLEQAIKYLQKDSSILSPAKFIF